MTYIDLGAWYRSRLGAGYDIVRGSRILAHRIASGQGHPQRSEAHHSLGARTPAVTPRAGTAGREVS